jgi:hypothetical protein
MQTTKSITGFLIVIILLTLHRPLSAQQIPLQSIRGKVVDKTSQSPLPGANITVLTTDPLMGAATDREGNFVISGVPTGRHSIRVSYIGYSTLTFDNQMVTSGKEFVIRIEMEENAIQGKEVEIIAKQRKDQPVNPMALISARSFTIDETSRYAGSYGDPARMAANYAGVVSTRDNRNDIIVRGNSPYSLKYRIDGMEVLNPNHFGATGTTGGPVTMLNSNMLANSDFLTGAFPAEYGNALSGIFDINLRNGNHEKREYWGQLGFNGLEFGLEGPFKKGKEASYLAAYRYSFTGLLEDLGVNLEESANYQDLSFKLNFPTKKAGVFSLTGIGGTSEIALLDYEKDLDSWVFDFHGENLRSSSALASLGLSHLYFLDANTRIRSNLSFITSGIETTIDTFSLYSYKPYRWAGEKSGETKISASVNLTRKFNARNSLDAGISYDLYLVNYTDSQYVHHEYIYYTDTEQNMSLLRAYAGLQHRFHPKLNSSVGLHFQFFTLNSSVSVEPRLSLKWDLTPLSALSFGFGLHSQLVPMMLYFTQTQVSDDQYIITNKNLDFMRSIHAVMGYDYLLTEQLRLKAEAYYQYLYDIPVKESIPQYSVINEGIDYYILRYDSLVSLGKGANYGIDLTLERFLHRNFYYLFTASVYRSFYEGFDEVKRTSAFDNRYVFNAVGGYELPFGRFKNQFLITGIRATWTGGRPYLPYDAEKTVAEGEVVYDWANAYEVRFDDYIRCSVRIGYRRNVKHANIQLLFDLVYRSNYTNIDLYRIDVNTGEIVQGYTMGFYPMATWRIQF